MKKEDNFGEELANQLRYTWRHRKGFKLFGKEIVKDNRIPGLILDTMDNLGLITKDGRKPLITSKEKTDYG